MKRIRETPPTQEIIEETTVVNKQINEQPPLEGEISIDGNAESQKESLEQIKAQIIGGGVKERENILSEAEVEDMTAQLKKLKEVLSRPDIAPAVKDLFLSAEVSSTILGTKPLSSIQPRVEQKVLGFITRIPGLKKQEVQQFLETLKGLGVDSTLGKKFKKEQKESSVQQIYLWRKDKIIATMKESGIFSDQELHSAEQDVEKFIEEDLSFPMPSSKVRRVGVLLGYALPDVKNAIRDSELKEKGGEPSEDDQAFLAEKIGRVFIQGIKGEIAWATRGEQTLESRRVFEKMRAALDLEKESLSQ